ncbi:hypothetical protein NX059_009653 [Plenodomus lindquistii]|nr:hypothetical protein NX059_009653 [Plenodomus lindquistii]
MSPSSLPGVSKFTLAGVSPAFAESSNSEPLTALLITQALPMLDLDDNSLSSATVSGNSSISDFWQDNTTTPDTFSLDDFLDQSPALLSMDKSGFTDDEGGCPKSVDLVNGIQMLFPWENTADSDFQGLASSPSDIAHLGHPQLDMFSKNQPHPLMRFIFLLTEMSSYEGRLLKLSSSMFHDYPIGDAIFLSHRFYGILLDHNRNTCISPTSRTSTSDFLLSVSCFVTLARIYSTIFDHLREYILQLGKASPTQSFTESKQYPLEADIHLYRGLKLSQLQPICLCIS